MVDRSFGIFCFARYEDAWLFSRCNGDVIMRCSTGPQLIVPKRLPDIKHHRFDTSDWELATRYAHAVERPTWMVPRSGHLDWSPTPVGTVCVPWLEPLEVMSHGEGIAATAMPTL